MYTGHRVKPFKAQHPFGHGTWSNTMLDEDSTIGKYVSTVSKRKVAVFTGSRAEYGLQYPIIKALAADPRLDYYLLVSGGHLAEDFLFEAER